MNDPLPAVQLLRVAQGAYKKWTIAFTLPAGQTLSGRVVTFAALVKGSYIRLSSPADGITVIDDASGTMEFQPEKTASLPITVACSVTGDWSMWLDQQPEPIASGKLTVDALVV